jgi:hypothetical protein
MGVFPGERGEKMRGAILKRCCLVGLGLAMLFSGGRIPAAQEARQNDNFLPGALFRMQDLIDKTAARLQKVNQDIRENDRTIGKAEDIMAVARQRNNKEAESAARDALQKAREAKKKNEETRVRMELTRSRAVASYAAIRNMLASGQGHGSDSPIRGMVSEYSGKVQISKRNGDRFDLNNENPGFLQPGDRIMTSGSSSAVIQTLGGRGVVQLAEYSELNLQEDTPEKQVLEVVRGKIYSAVDKADDFEKMLQDKMKEYRDDLLDLSKRGWTSTRNRINKLEVRTINYAMAVRGTKFTVELKDEETTAITVLEGAVEARDLKGENQVIVEEGFRVIMTKGGVANPQKIADLEKWWEK